MGMLRKKAILLSARIVSFISEYFKDNLNLASKN